MEILPELKQLVLDTGEFIREERASFSEANVERKGGANNLVSYVDRTAEEKLMTGCRKLLPGSGFIREEGEPIDADATWRWIIDPLDGTTNFIQDIPAYCISIALQKDEVTELGIVYDVPRKEMFLAIRGEGAWRNGEPIRVSGHADFSQSIFATGFPYVQSDRFHDYLTAIASLIGATRGIRRFGAAALDLAWVACGRIDAFFELGLNAWDVAAGELLVLEAGGKVSDFKGTANHLFGKQIAASNGGIHPPLLELLEPMA